MAIDKDYGDIRDAVGNGLTVNPVRTMMNHATTDLFFDHLTVDSNGARSNRGLTPRKANVLTLTGPDGVLVCFSSTQPLL